MGSAVGPVERHVHAPATTMLAVGQTAVSQAQAADMLARSAGFGGGSVAPIVGKKKDYNYY